MAAAARPKHARDSLHVHLDSQILELLCESYCLQYSRRISWCTSKAKAATLSEWSHAFEKLYTEQWISSTARIVRGDIVCDRRECGARTLQFSWRCWGYTRAEASNYRKLELLRQVRRSAPSASSSEKILFTVSWSCISQAACTLVCGT